MIIDIFAGVIFWGILFIGTRKGIFGIAILIRIVVASGVRLVAASGFDMRLILKILVAEVIFVGIGNVNVSIAIVQQGKIVVTSGVAIGNFNIKIVVWAVAIDINI